MCGILGWGIGTTVLGGILVIVSCVISFVVLPNIVENTIISETVLEDDTIQLERFAEIPFPLTFSVRFFNLTNSDEYLNGHTPILEEIGPYVYKLYQTREISSMDEDTINYYRLEHFEFDALASYPLTDRDNVTIVNVPYHAIIQVAESLLPNSLLSFLNGALHAIFGQFTTPVITLPIQDLLFNGIPLCVGDGGAVGTIACDVIRNIGANAQNLEILDDGSVVFSILNYKQGKPSSEYKVFRGLDDHSQLGEIITYNHTAYFSYWRNELVNDEEQTSICNTIKGTDSAIFAPFVDINEPLYAINTDICRTVELRYEADSEVEGIPTVRFGAKEWFLDNDEGCYCLNVTRGITREDGCLLKGAMEMYTCQGAFLVLSYPHFLYADEIYKQGVVGLNADAEKHQIFLDLEPNTGVPVRGYKRAQFNIFSRPVEEITGTANLNTTLVPFLWIEEGITLPEEFIDEIKTKLLGQLRLVEIIVPVIVSLTAALFVLGIILVICAKCRKTSGPTFVNN